MASEYTPTADDFRLAWEVPGKRMRDLDEKYVTAIERHHEAQRGIAALKAEAWDEGCRSGRSRAMRYMSDEPNVPAGVNPYLEEATE